MAKEKKIDYRHWRYFLSLEDDFIKTTRYVELCEDNFDTHSIEFTRLLISICAELETILKLICIVKSILKVKRMTKQGEIEIEIEKANINEIKYKLLEIGYKYFDRMTVSVVNYNLKKIKPFLNWNIKSSNFADWWTAYNNIKHDREKNYADAKMKNVIEALVGLFIAELYLFDAKYGSINKLTPIPKLLGLEYFSEPIETEGGSKQLIKNPII